MIIEDAVKQINLTILSMSVKQKILDNLKSEMFSQNIYTEYINMLIMTNLKLMDNQDLLKFQEYKELIKHYIYGEITNPDDIIESLQI